MSEASHDHKSPFRTPKQLVAALIAALLVPIVVIVLVIQYVVNEKRGDAGDQSPEAVARRISPVANEGFLLKDANAPKQAMSATEVYNTVCAACHGTGAAGAPKLGDNAAWAPRLAQGYETLVGNAIRGIRAMPPKGGKADLDDIDVARAVVHIANASGAKFTEPQAKAAAQPAGK